MNQFNLVAVTKLDAEFLKGVYNEPIFERLFHLQKLEMAYLTCFVYEPRNNGVFSLDKLFL